MANVLVDESSLQEIASAIREKSGTQDTFTPAEMGSAISDLPTGSTVVLPDGIRFQQTSNDNEPYMTSFPDLEKCDTSNLTTTQNMFRGCYRLTTIPLFDTSNVTNMQGTFYGCTALTSVPLFNTSKASKMNYIFYNCTSLTTIPLFDTSNVEDLNSAFYGCAALTSVPLFNTSKAQWFANCFQNCRHITSIPNLDMSSAKRISSLFQDCVSLVDVPVFNWSNIDASTSSTRTYIQNVFSSCTSLSDESLNNIMASCLSIQGTVYSTAKNLKYIGLTSAQATRCQSLSNYADFIAAGWTTGY